MQVPKCKRIKYYIFNNKLLIFFLFFGGGGGVVGVVLLCLFVVGGFYVHKLIPWPDVSEVMGSRCFHEITDVQLLQN